MQGILCQGSKETIFRPKLWLTTEICKRLLVSARPKPKRQKLVLVSFKRKRNFSRKEDFDRKQDLGQKCSAWIPFGLKIKILLPPSLSPRDRVKCGWVLGLNCYTLQKPTYKSYPLTSLKPLKMFAVGGWVVYRDFIVKLELQALGKSPKLKTSQKVETSWG